MALRWDHKLETGYQEIDEQHRRIYRALNEVFKAKDQGLSHEAVAKLLDFLLDYIERHFEMEETIMESVSYPGLAQHKAQHEEFRAEIKHIAKNYRKTGHTALINIKLQTCSTRWLREHIGSEDRKMAEFLRSVHPLTD